MSRFKKLKSLFIVEDENAKKAAPAKKPQPKEKPRVVPNSKRPASTAPLGPQKPVTGKAKPKFTDRLLKVIEENNQPGFDYLEYKQTLKAMAKMNMDEPTTFKSAFAAAQAMGTSPSLLVESVQHYLNILESEEKKFMAALQHQTEKNIGGRQQSLKEAEERMKLKQEQIKRLQEEIATENEQLASTRKELAEVSEKINVTKADFEASYGHLKTQMMADVKKINQYLSA